MPGPVEGGQFSVPSRQGAPQSRHLERRPFPMFRLRESVARFRSAGRRRLPRGAKRRCHLQRPLQRNGGQPHDDPKER